MPRSRPSSTKIARVPAKREGSDKCAPYVTASAPSRSCRSATSGAARSFHLESTGTLTFHHATLQSPEAADIHTGRHEGIPHRGGVTFDILPIPKG